MKNRKYDNSKIFIVCRSMIQVKKFLKAFNRGDYSSYLQSIEECGDVSFRLENNIYQGFGNKDFYLNNEEYWQFKPVEFSEYFIPTFIEV
ncbi:MAG TPA: hypothetical protein PK151_06305, partial [Caldisericia bacterium]|nr:hypothetical protein [Caldisericia bacterium]